MGRYNKGITLSFLFCSRSGGCFISEEQRCERLCRTSSDVVQQAGCVCRSGY